MLELLLYANVQPIYMNAFDRSFYQKILLKVFTILIAQMSTHFEVVA